MALPPKPTKTAAPATKAPVKAPNPPAPEEDTAEQENEAPKLDFNLVAAAEAKATRNPLLTRGDYLLQVDEIVARSDFKTADRSFKAMLKVNFTVLESVGEEGVTRPPESPASYLVVEGENRKMFFQDVQAFFTALNGGPMTAEDMNTLTDDVANYAGSQIRCTVVTKMGKKPGKDGKIPEFANCTFHHVPASTDTEG